MRLGIIGLGTVGEGVLEILSTEENNFKNKGIDLEVLYACDINLDRGFSFEFDKSILTKDFNDILNDEKVDTVVELIGGETIAKHIIVEAIKKGKNVITANKALLAKHAKEIFSLAKEKQVNIFYEASVGGGIPIISPLQESLIANNILGIRGIINGTANYILSEMKEKNLDFDTVLKDAMKKGYAEADPTYDIEGIDTAHKICVLASLAFNSYIDFDKVIISGISKIDSIDIQIAEKLGYNIKLIASAKYLGEKLAVEVAPTLLSNKELLANVDNVFNAIEVESDYAGTSLFYGRGAGKDATASAVVADIVKASKESPFRERYYFNLEDEADLINENQLIGTYYLRIETSDFKEEIRDLSFKVFEEDKYTILITNKIKRADLMAYLENKNYTLLNVN